MPGRARKAGERLTEAIGRSTGVAGVRGLGLLLAIELDTEAIGCDAATVAAALLDAGVVVNAVTPTALRLAPSLLISDDEIDLAVALDRPGRRRDRMRHFLEITDLERGGARPTCSTLAELGDPPQVLRGSGASPAVREAVGADPHLDGDGGRRSWAAIR